MEDWEWCWNFCKQPNQQWSYQNVNLEWEKLNTWNTSGVGIEGGPRKLKPIVKFSETKDINGVNSFKGFVSFCFDCGTVNKAYSDNKTVQIGTWTPNIISQNKENFYYTPSTKIIHFQGWKKWTTHSGIIKRIRSKFFSQFDQDKMLYQIYDLSRKISRTDKSNHSTKLELLAVVAFEKLKSFLLGTKFPIVSNSIFLVNMLLISNTDLDNKWNMMMPSHVIL